MTPVSYVSEPFIYPGGTPAADVLARVYRGGSKALATLFYDSLGTRAPNPMRTDAAGLLDFYAEPGAYDIFINGTTFSITVSGDGGPGAPAWNMLTFSAGAPGNPGVGRSFVHNDTGRNLTIVGVRITAATVSGLPLVVDLNKNGTTVFTDQGHRPQLPVSGASGTVKVTVIDQPVLLPGDALSVDVDQGNFTHLVVQVAVR